MNQVLGKLSSLVTARPWITLLVLFIVTLGLGAGAVFRAPLPSTAETLPDNSPIADAMSEVSELFGDHGELSAVTLVFRGDALTPAGLSQMDALINDIVDDPGVQELLAPTNPIFAPSGLIKFALQTDSFESVTQAQIDAVRVLPEIQPALAAMTGTDTDGTRVAIASISLLVTGDDRVRNAERTINELSIASEGPLRASSVSFIVIEDEYKEATETGMGPLIGIAFLLIALLLLLFMRSLSDMWLTLGGLLVSIIWIIGAEGWLGPNALGLIGPPNSLTTMVPIIVIGLTVDYAIQTISHYREQRLEGGEVREAIRADCASWPSRCSWLPSRLSWGCWPAYSPRSESCATSASSRNGHRDEPDRHADVGPGQPGDHGPATREAGDLEAAPSHRARLAGH